MSLESKMVVAVTMRLSPAVEYDEQRDAISHDWVNYLISFGMIPILIPNTIRDPGQFMDAVGAKKLLLTSGDCIGTLLSESENPKPTIRDRNEFACLKAALDRNIPVLGVCRGLQIINLFLGGQLSRSLPCVNGRQHNEGMHKIKLLKDGREIWVNSYHKEGVLLAQLSSQLEPIAMCEGGVVEAARNDELKIIALQWHPERSSPFPDYNKEIMQEWMLL